jgi:hypothetical protein
MARRISETVRDLPASPALSVLRRLHRRFGLQESSGHSGRGAGAVAAWRGGPAASRLTER